MISLTNIHSLVTLLTVTLTKVLLKYFTRNSCSLKNFLEIIFFIFLVKFIGLFPPAIDIIMLLEILSEILLRKFLFNSSLRTYVEVNKYPTNKYGCYRELERRKYLKC